MFFMNEATFRASLFGSAVTLLHFNKTVILVRKKDNHMIRLLWLIAYSQKTNSRGTTIKAQKWTERPITLIILLGPNKRSTLPNAY